MDSSVLAGDRAGRYASDGRAGRLSRTHGHHYRAVRARRADRHHRAYSGRLAEQVAQAILHHRKSRRRCRQYRHGRGGARAAGRLYAAADLDRHRRQYGAVQEPALRSVQGFRADIGIGEFAKHPRRQLQVRHQHPRRTGCARKSGSGHVQLFIARYRHQILSDRRKNSSSAPASR
jgi:hypothetical protein